MIDRRRFIRDAALGVMGANVLATGSETFAARRNDAATDVSFVAGSDRRQMMSDAMQPFTKQLERALDGKKVLVKPNCVWHDNPLCATHPDAIRGVLDFLGTIHDGPVSVGESTASPKGTLHTFDQYGYTPLAREYDVSLVDLNAGGYSVEWIRGGDGRPLDIKIIDTFLDPETFIISLARMKAHNCVVATLSFKNLVLAAPINFAEGHPEFTKNQQEKAKMHAGDINGINWNMYRIARRRLPDFAVIDGVVGMEGNGPTQGTPVEHGVALAGFDSVATDRVGIELMGVDYRDVAYLQWSAADGLGEGDLSRIRVLGPDYRRHVIPYKMHDNIDWQLSWRDS